MLCHLYLWCIYAMIFTSWSWETGISSLSLEAKWSRISRSEKNSAQLTSPVAANTKGFDVRTTLGIPWGGSGFLHLEGFTTGLPISAMFFFEKVFGCRWFWHNAVDDVDGHLSIAGVNHVNAGIGLMMVGWPGPPKAYLTMTLTGGDWLCLMRLLKHWWGKAGSDHREVASGVIKRGKILEVNGWRLKCWECHETKWRIVQILQQRRGMLNRVWWCVVLRALSFCRVGLIKQCRQHLRSSVPNR